MRLTLTDELYAFLEANSGEGEAFASPEDLVLFLIQERKARQDAADAAAFGEAVLEGYADVRRGRAHAYRGDLRSMVDEHRARYDR